MVFNSYLFLFIFLPVTLVGWFGLNRVNYRAADYFLIGMNLWFYGSFSPWYLLILAVSIGMNYGFGRAMASASPAQTAAGNRGRVKVSAWKTGILIIGIILNLLYLVWFKYLIPAAVGSSAGTTGFWSVGLPIGMSYYTFSQISFLIDLYRGEVVPDSFLTYLLFSTYFPKMAEGPIVRYQEMADQFRSRDRRRPDRENIQRGCVLLFLGMARKLLIADILAPAVSYGFETAYYLDTLSSLFTMCGYALQLYFDFSGFCDMAMGVSKMMNLDLPLNFNAPFRAESFADIWRRWHMTLTRFFTRYVYIPLGGSRRGLARTCINTMIVFLLSGLWHGISLNFIVWGLLCGALVVLERLTGNRHRTSGGGKRRGRIQTAITRIVDFLLFAAVFVFFGAPDMDRSIALLRNLFHPVFPGWMYRIAGQTDPAEFWILNKVVQHFMPSAASPVLVLELCAVMAAAFLFAFGKKTAVQYAETMHLTRKNAVRMGILISWCLVSFTGVTTFLYFKF